MAELRPAGVTTEEEPPGVVDLPQTFTELLEVWAPVQSETTQLLEEQLDTAFAAVGNKRLIKRTTGAKALNISRNLFRSMFHSQTGLVIHRSSSRMRPAEAIFD